MKRERMNHPLLSSTSPGLNIPLIDLKISSLKCKLIFELQTQMENCDPLTLEMARVRYMDEKGRLTTVISLFSDISNSISDLWLREAFRTFRLLPKNPFHVGGCVMIVKRNGCPDKNSSWRGRRGTIISFANNFFMIKCNDNKTKKANSTQLVSLQNNPFPVWENPLWYKKECTYNLLQRKKQDSLQTNQKLFNSFPREVSFQTSLNSRSISSSWRRLQTWH